MMEELDISMYSSSTSSSLDLSKLVIENNLVSKALDEDIVYQKNDLKTETNIPNATSYINNNSNDIIDENESYCNSIVENFCLSLWNVNNKLDTIIKDQNSPQTVRKDSNETLKNLNVETIETNLKRRLKIDECIRQEILDFDSWNLEYNNYSNIIISSNEFIERNFNNNDITPIRAVYDHDSNRNDALNQTLDLMKKTRSLTTISSLNSKDDFSLKRAISEICKTQRLSDVSTVTGSFSLKLNEDKDLVAVYVSKH